MTKWNSAFAQDLVERVLATFIVTLIPMWVAAENVAHLDWVNALEVSASAAGLTLLKCLLANMATGDPPSASLVGVTSTKH